MINRSKLNILTMDLPLIKKYLKVDFDDDDDLIELFWEAAISHIESLIQFKIDEWPDGPPPKEFAIAALMLVSSFYDQRSTLYIPNGIQTSVEQLIKPHYRFGSQWDGYCEVKS